MIIGESHCIKAGQKIGIGSWLNKVAKFKVTK